MGRAHLPLVLVLVFMVTADAALRQMTTRGEYPYVALAATTWGECSAAIVSRLAVLAPATCLPKGYPKTGRVEAGNNKFKTSEDFSEPPTQSRIISNFIKHRTQADKDDNTIMIIQLIKPFVFSNFLMPIPLTKDARPKAARVMLVGFGMGGTDVEKRVRTVTEVLVMPCEGVGGEDLLCPMAADCRPDHGALVVTDGRLLGMANAEPLCEAELRFLAPYREWVERQVQRIEDEFLHPKAFYQRPRSAMPRMERSRGAPAACPSALLSIVLALW